MEINTDINILGGIPGFEMAADFLKREGFATGEVLPTTIKTEKSVKRFEKAVSSTLIKFGNETQKEVIRTLILGEGISSDSKLMLFWNASFNNQLLDSINSQIFFPAYYSGRVVLKQTEIAAYLNELKSTETQLQKWSESTIEITASKYLTLLKKFNLLEGGSNKSIKHPFLNDKTFILFIYWLLAIENKTNIFKSQWIKYSFSEKEFFIERVLQKSFARYIEVKYTGDKLQILPLIEYADIYDFITQS